MSSAIDNKNKFITDASQVALHALISKAPSTAANPKALAKKAREYAIDLWRVMRVPVQ